MLKPFVHVEMSASCYQYHVTKQSLISLQGSTFVDCLRFPLFLDTTECVQLYSLNAAMKRFIHSCLHSFSLEILTGSFTIVPSA